MFHYSEKYTHCDHEHSILSWVVRHAVNRCPRSSVNRKQVTVVLKDKKVNIMALEDVYLSLIKLRKECV